MEEKIGRDITINYQLVGNPVFTGNWMEFPLLGEIYSQVSPQECPANICPKYGLPDIINGEEVQTVVSDFVANSAGFSFFREGKLVLVLRDQDVPKWSPIRLNTSSFEFFLPQLYNKFPNMAMQIKLYSTVPPLTVFQTSGALVKAIGNLEVYVVQGAALIPAFTLTGWISAAGVATVEGNLLYGSLSFVQGNFTFQSSNFGPFHVEPLDQLLKLLFSNGILPAVNTLLKRGFHLPTVKGLTFINPTVGFGNHYLWVTTNAQYSPPAPTVRV